MELQSSSYFPANEAPLQEGGDRTRKHRAQMTEGAGANEVTGDSEFLGHG
jgi:hypothetical protein